MAAISKIDIVSNIPLFLIEFVNLRNEVIRIVTIRRARMMWFLRARKASAAGVPFVEKGGRVRGRLQHI